MLNQQEGYVQYNIEFYRKMANRYDIISERILSKLRQTVVEISEIKKGEKVLDLCTGTGQAAEWFAKSGCQVVGVDLSRDMLRIARIKRKHITFREMDSSRLSFADNSFEVVNIQLGLHDMPLQVIRRTLLEIRRVAKKRVIIAEPYAPKNWIMKNIFRYITFPEFAEASDWLGYTKLDLKGEIETSGFTIEKETRFAWGLVRIYKCLPE